jgi:nucleotide-binding universal stress UspA family protein
MWVRPVTPTALAAGGAIAGASAVDDRALAVSQESLLCDAEADVAAMARELGCDAVTGVVTGDPGVEPCRIAEAERLDLCVGGWHGWGFLQRVLLGSVSHHVLHHAPCPVLVVGDAAVAEEAEPK